jgi:plasmid stabilization system protein ParE
MSYTVHWKPTAENQLAAIWESAADRARVTAAANEIDRLLRLAPNQQGESRTAGRRIMFALPLCVRYRIYENRRTVVVSTVAYIQRRR